MVLYKDQVFGRTSIKGIISQERIFGPVVKSKTDQSEYPSVRSVARPRGPSVCLAGCFDRHEHVIEYVVFGHTIVLALYDCSACGFGEEIEVVYIQPISIETESLEM